MTDRLRLSAPHRALIEALLRAHLPNVEVWAYGSRVNGRGHDGSDLDLVLRAPDLKEIPTGELRDFQNAVRDSTIPFLVEARDWARLPDRFQQEIEQEHVVLEVEGRQNRDGWQEECWGNLATLEHGRAKAALRTHATPRAPGPITPPLRGSREDKGASPQASRWGDSNAAQPPRLWPEIRRQYTSRSLHHAQGMRQDQTSAEGLLWYYLRNKQLGGYKFCRQQPIGPYIADFACLPKKLLIELDGGQHADPKVPDEQRDQFLRQQGYRVLRFWNHEVFTDCFSVLERVYEALADPPPPQPAPEGLASSTPPQGGSDWRVDRARAYLSRMDPDIAVLFPDRFVDSELGEIPEGWGVGTVNQLAETNQNGGTPKRSESTYWEPGEIPWLTSSEVRQSLVIASQYFISKVGLARSSAKVVPARSILVALCGATAGQASMNDQPLSTNQAVCSIVPRKGNRYFCLMGLRDKVPHFMGKAAGSAQQIISKKIIEDTAILLPHVALRSAYDALVEPSFDRMFCNLKDRQALLTQRNMLLPELITGKRPVNY